MELDQRVPIVWDASQDVEREPTEQLCGAFELVCLKCVARLKAADLAAKTYHDCTPQLAGISFVEGTSVYSRQHKTGKLLLGAEGYYIIFYYANDLHTSAVVWDLKMEREVRIHSALQVRA